MNKKAQGMPLNTIVIAAIVLVVMVVLILIFTGRMGKTNTDLEKTENLAKARAECLGKMGTVKKSCDITTETPVDPAIEGLNANNLVCCKKKTQTETELEQGEGCDPTNDKCKGELSCEQVGPGGVFKCS